MLLLGGHTVHFLAKVDFLNGLITTNQKKVQYKDGLIANVEIITNNINLLQRFFYGIINIVKK